VRTGGGVVCWGNNNAGQLGTGTTTPWTTPTPVFGISDGKLVATGRQHTCVLRQSGEIYCFGNGSSGQLGQGLFSTSLAPVKVIDTVDVSGPTGAAGPTHAPIPWINLSANEFFTCGLRASGEILCWGSGSNGQLGNGSISNRKQPSLVTGVSDAKAIANGRFHACAVRATGNVACWGASLNLGRTGPDLLLPVLIGPELSPFANAYTISASGEHTCATTTFGSTFCWGRSTQGELAGAATSPLPIIMAPPPGTALTNTVASTSGLCHTCVLLEDGSLRCWGAAPPNPGICEKQLGTGLSTGSTTPLAPILPPP
jgi:alpha-tubulin suppressor-like RCC1 family protein